MGKPKINIDKPDITDERILKHKDFDKVMEQAAKMAPSSPWGSWKMWAGTTAVLVIGAVVTFYIQTNMNGNDSASNAASNEEQITDVAANVPATETKVETTVPIGNSETGTTPTETGTVTATVTSTTTVETGNENPVNTTNTPEPTPPVSNTLITVTPSDTSFTANEYNFRKITLSDDGKISRVILNGGSVTNNGEFYKFAIGENSGNVTLKVYEELPNGEEFLKFKQVYTIKTPALPSVYICGVKNGGNVERQKLLREGKLTALIGQHNQSIQVLNFKLKTTSGALNSTNNRFTVEMKRLIHQLKVGGTLNFVDIHGLMPDGTVKVLEPISIRITDANQTGVGQ
jgi:hypothetical protein